MLCCWNDNLFAFAALRSDPALLAVHPTGFRALCKPDLSNIGQLISRPCAGNFDAEAARAVVHALFFGFAARCMRGSIRCVDALALGWLHVRGLFHHRLSEGRFLVS